MNKAKKYLMICLISGLFLTGTGFADVEQPVEDPKEITEVTDEVEVTETEEETEEVTVDVEQIEEEKSEPKAALVAPVATATLSAPITPVTTAGETRTITAQGNWGVDWVLYDDGELVLSEGELRARGSNDTAPGNFAAYKDSIVKITVDDLVNIQDGKNLFGKYKALETIEGGTNFTFIGADISLYEMFYQCNRLSKLDVSGWDTKNVTNMHGMFNGCSSIASLDVSGWDTKNVTSMGYMFSWCKTLAAVDVSGWDTKNVTNMNSMFDYCHVLTELDVSEWDTGNVTSMSYMFQRCDELVTLDVSGWDTKNVTNMNYMFTSCGLRTIDVSKWDTGNVKHMSNMFSSSDFKALDLSGWNTKNVINMKEMFRNMISLRTLDLSGWDTSSVIYKDYIFKNNMIYTIALGENSIFSGWDTLLTENWMSPTPSWRTERWIGLTTGNVYNDSDEFMENYDGSIPDTYQWEYLVSINFDLNGGDRNPLISTKTINQLSTVSSIIKDIPNPTKKGHEFLGWEIVGDLAWDMETTTPHGYASSNDLNIEEMATTPINLKAKWKAKEYNIIYNLDGGENATTNPTGYTYGVGVKSFEEPTKEGHTFLGWYSDADFTTEVTSISETQLEDVILYAKWKANDYTINYELDGGANTSENPLGYTFGVGVKAFKAPTKVGFTFEGWYSDADFTTEVTNISETQMEDVTLYAKWELNRYTITYELDGGENHKDNSAGFAFGEGVEKLEEPTKAGYTFLGWFDAQTGGNEVVKIAKERNEDITLYARWKQNPQEPIVNPDKDKENPTENTPNDNNTVINADESDNGSTTENVVNNPNVAPEFNGSTANVSGSVQTGDETNIMTLYVLLGLALLSGGMITRRKLKK